MSTGLPRRLLSWISWLGMILLSLLLIAVGEWLPLMPAVQRFQAAYPSINQLLIGVTVVMIIVGFLLLVFTQFLVHVPDPNLEAQAQTGQDKSRDESSVHFDSGKNVSAGFSDEARFWRVRQAFRDGEWWREPRWQRFTLMMLGGILLFYGLFGLLFLLFPPGVKFLLLVVVCYATARSIYAFAVDRPSPTE